MRVGRPTKFNKIFVKVLESVLEDFPAEILDNNELLLIVNEKLPDEYKIGKEVFYRWTQEDWLKHKDIELYNEFMRLIKKARIIKKVNIYKKMFEQQIKSWQRLAWVLERVYPERFRMKNEFEVSQNNLADIEKITFVDTKELYKVKSIAKKDYKELKEEVKNN